MPKKPESALGLAPLSHKSNFTDHNIVAVRSKRPSNQEERWIVEEYQKQALIMVGIDAKAVQAMRLIAEIHKEGVSVFEEATGHILRVKDEPRGKEQQAYVD